MLIEERMLPEVARFFSRVLKKPSVCEACGNVFTCGAGLAGCWCSEVKLNEEMLTELRSRYRDCLCRSCLEQFAQLDLNAEEGEACAEDAEACQ